LSSSDAEYKVQVPQTQACAADNTTKHYEQQQNEPHNSKDVTLLPTSPDLQGSKRAAAPN